MNKLYIITGPAGVGKSTISKALAESMNKSALVEGDDIYHLVCGGYESPWKEGNHLDVFWKNCIDVIRNFLNSGYDVVFNYIISKEKIEELRKVFASFETKFVVLIADEETILKRDALRAKDCQMKERCIELLNNFKKQNFNSDSILDTSDLSVEEVIRCILSSDKYIL